MSSVQLRVSNLFDVLHVKVIDVKELLVILFNVIVVASSL